MRKIGFTMLVSVSRSSTTMATCAEQWFETSIEHLYFAGVLANHSFGPICRFVLVQGAIAANCAAL